MGAVADRDFVLETLQWGSFLMQHISRWAEGLIIYSSAERTPTAWRELRGNSGRAFGDMAGFIMTLKGLPATYNKGLQEFVEPLLDHVKTVGDSIQIAEGVLSTLATQPEKMRAALDPFMLVTDVADYLVRKGVAEQTGTPMNELTYEQMKGVDARFEEDISETFDHEKSVEMRAAKGGMSKACVLEQVKVLVGMIA
ncbi:argininosuccinate lyase [Diaporthe eres]|uniref:Argininosuccinate lyase n=1 Tax=Diaporthe eres TaxID=83184 RepID=A0ABR1NUG3_DIAER